MGTKPVEAILREKKIYQITNPKLVQSSPALSVREAVALMQHERSGYVVIAKHGKVVGIFTENDLIWKIMAGHEDWSKSVTEFMTKDPVVLTPRDSVGKAIQLMRLHRVYHIPLVEEQKKLVGVLSVRTLIRFLAEFYPTEVYNLPPDPTQVMETPEGG